MVPIGLSTSESGGPRAGESPWAGEDAEQNCILVLGLTTLAPPLGRDLPAFSVDTLGPLMGEVLSEAQCGTEMSCDLGMPSTPADAGWPPAAPGERHAQNPDGAPGAEGVVLGSV